MLARRLLWLLGAEFAIYAVLLFGAARGTLGWSTALGIIATTHIVLRCAVVPLGVVIAWCVDRPARVDRRTGVERPTRSEGLATGAALATFARECLALWRNYVLAPFDAWLAPPVPPAVAPTQRCEVLLVHGILCNRVVWRPFAAALARHGIQSHAVNVEPVLGELDAMADGLARQIGARPRRRTLVVAHSMGGLVARRMLQRHPEVALVGLVTIGTPHHGAAQAAFVPAEAARAMRRGSAWLTALDRGPPPPAALRRLAIRSIHDELVSPADSARWNGARELVLGAVGHVALLEDERVIEAVRAELVAVEAGVAAGTDVGTLGPGPGAGAGVPDTDATGGDADARGPDADARGPDASARGPDPYARSPDADARGRDANARGPDASTRGPDASARSSIAFPGSRAQEALR